MEKIVKHKTFYFIGLVAFALLSPFLPASIASAAKLSSSRGTARQLVGPTGAFSFAPYIFVNPASTTDNNPKNILNDVKQTGVKYYKLAFITANSCQGVWGTGDSTALTSPVGQDSVKTVISQLHQQGGDAVIIFGGLQGHELAQACQDIPSLEKQYQIVIDTYQVKHLEFAVVSEDPAVSDQRNQALAALQKANPGLSITYTFPVTTAGLTQDKVQLLQDALKNGVKVDAVNIMKFNFGPPSGDMKAKVVSTAHIMQTQLASIHLAPILSITLMIDMTDQHETFRLDNAKNLRPYAQQYNYQLSMWTIGRDKACPGGATEAVSPMCVSIAQTPFRYIGLFKGLNVTPPPLPANAPVSPANAPVSPANAPVSPANAPVPPANAPVPPANAPTQRTWSFPCSDIPGPAGRLVPDESVIRRDWLSGDAPVATRNITINGGGRISYTYSTDTDKLKPVTDLFGLMQGLGFALIMPSIILIGYQFMLGASTFRYAGALEGLSRLILGAVAVLASYELVDMMISTQNSFIAGIIALHGEHPFSIVAINGKLIPYRLAGEPLTSYRGIVVPVSRWGCAVNDFIGVLSPSFLTNTLGSIVPLIGGLAPLAGHVTSIPVLIQRCGELLLAILSCLLAIQVFVRIVLLNYYTLMAPLAFGCWALPGRVGQRVVLLWFKGFFTVLFAQTFQLFVLTTLPLLLPTIPPVAADRLGMMQGLLLQFPPILTLCAALMAPLVLGVSVNKALGNAGSMAGGVVVAVGSTATRMG